MGVLYRRASAGVVAAALACLGAAILSVGFAPRSALFEPFDDPDISPQDPIVSPLFMAYDAGQGAAHELARVAGPLQGAFSTRSQAQLFQGLRGVDRSAPGWELVEMPQHRQLHGLGATGQEVPSDDELTRQALESYRQDLQQLPNGQSEAPGSFVPGFSGDTAEDEITRKALESYRQELAASHLEEAAEPESKPLVVDHVALDNDRLVLGAPVKRRGKGAVHRQASMRKVQRLYERLHNPGDRAVAAGLLREDAMADALKEAVDRQHSFRKLESSMQKELRLSALKIKDAMQVKQLGEQQLARYRDAVHTGEKLDADNVHYLKAVQNYAVEARAEVLDAKKRDVAAAQVLAGAPAVLQEAHKDQVKARVTDDEAGLRKAELLIDREVHKVEQARAGEAAAAKERADANENAFVARVINRVRQQRFGGPRPGVKALAEEGAKGHKDVSEANMELRINRARHEHAEAVLKRARFQDEALAAAQDAEKDSTQAIAALAGVEEEGRRIDVATARLRQMSRAAKVEEEAAKARELAAAALRA
jgi:hypothetical protein